ncbi:hypothetical protein MHOCP_23350 [Moorella humiferrea]|uniref:Panacea domain-containing protein n=1 Tax=Neomoorella humiferrea TaxID=676965 RepID=UPI0030D35F40
MNSGGKLKEVIIEILKRTEKGLTRTQLVKLCFLIDRLAVERLGRPITGLCYSMYYYGPYSPDIIDAAREMEEEERLVKYTGISLTTGEPYYIYRLADNEKQMQSISGLEKNEIIVIDEVVKEHGSLSLKKLLDFVYDLPEVKEARLGEKINWSEISS